MGKGRVRRELVTEVAGDHLRRRPDELIVEEPMTVQLDGVTVATTMRTPGHDFDLAVGFCHNEGLLISTDGEPTPVAGVRYCGSGLPSSTEFNVVNVETSDRAVGPSTRLGITSSSCGWCGSDQLDDMLARLAPFADRQRFALSVLGAVPNAVVGHQELFGRTGAVHAAAAFDQSGELKLLREDVGRHNAVDKVVGALLIDGTVPNHELGLFVSGRASVEMVQKAWAGGFSTVVAVSAPTALAVAAARQANMTLIGFVRPRGFNIYSPERWD